MSRAVLSPGAMTTADSSPQPGIFDPNRVADTRMRAAELLFGERTPPPIGRFAVVRTLGRGGMGTVYLATDPDLDRAVAR